MRHHPSRFGPLGGARWRGAIYGDGLGPREPLEGSVYHGPFGFAPFQTIYPQGVVAWWDLFAGVLWIGLAVLALACHRPLVVVAIFAGSLLVAWLRANQNLPAAAPRDSRERMLLWLLCWLQPVAREWARLKGMVRLRARPSWHPSLPEIFIPKRPRKTSRRIAVVSFWSEAGVGREQWLASLRQLLAEKKTSARDDDGWHGFDIEMAPRSLVTWAFLSVTEYHGGPRLLTRVAVLQRISRWGALGLLCACVALWLLITRAMLWFGFHGEVMTAVLMVCVIIAMLFIARVNCINLVHQAAGRTGLKRLESSDRTSALAAASDSRQSV